MTDTNSSQNESLNSDVSEDKWIEILKMLTPESCKNLQSALNQFSHDRGYDFSHNAHHEHDYRLEPSSKLPDATELFQTQQPQSMIIGSSVVSSMSNSQFAPNVLSSQVALFSTQSATLNTLTTPLVFAEIPLSRPTELQFNQVSCGSAAPPTSTNKDIINGLDTLAAAALANTNCETNVTSTTSISTIQQQILAPVLDTRQSPTIGQTPKRLAATAATRAEEEANREEPLLPEGGVRFVDSKRSRLNIGALNTSLIRDHVGELASSVDGGNKTNSSHLLLNEGITCKPEEGIEMMGMNQTFTNQLLPTPCTTNGELSWQHQQSLDLKRSESALDIIGGRINSQRKFNEENASEDEAARKEKRRERNRVAAAKCRQNRQNQIERLQEKKTALEKKNDEISVALTVVRQQRKHLLSNIQQHALGGCPEATSFLEVNFMELGSISAAILPSFSNSTTVINKQENMLPGLTLTLQNNNNTNNNTTPTSIRLNITSTDAKLFPFTNLISQAVSNATQLPLQLESIQAKNVVLSGPVRPNTLITKRDDSSEIKNQANLSLQQQTQYHQQQQWLSPINSSLLAAAVEKKRICTPNAWVNTSFAPPMPTVTTETMAEPGVNRFARTGAPLSSGVEEAKNTTATSG